MGKPGLKVSGWMGAAMWVEGDSLVIRRPPSGKTSIPLRMVEGFTFTNAAIGQKGYRVVVAGGSLQQSRVTSIAKVSDDPYLIPLKPGRKNRDECEAFGAQVMGLVAQARGYVPPPAPPAPVQAAAPVAPSADRLRELASLRDDGLISVEEFEDAKARYLAG